MSKMPKIKVFYPYKNSFPQLCLAPAFNPEIFTLRFWPLSFYLLP
jgi:hypothetical protein